MPDNAGWKIYPGVPQKGVVDPHSDVPFYPDTDDSEEGSTGWLKGLFLRLELRIGEITDAIKGLQKSVDKKVAAPVWYRTAQSVTIAGGVGIARLAGPDQGHIWHIRAIQVGGLTTTTVAAGRADVFVTAADVRSFASPLAQMGLADWRDQMPALPTSVNYGAEVMPLRFNEELYVVFSGATNGQQYVAAVQVTDYEEAALQQEYLL